MDLVSAVILGERVARLRDQKLAGRSKHADSLVLSEPQRHLCLSSFGFRVYGSRLFKSCDPQARSNFQAQLKLLSSLHYNYKDPEQKQTWLNPTKGTTMKTVIMRGPDIEDGLEAPSPCALELR